MAVKAKLEKNPNGGFSFVIEEDGSGDLNRIMGELCKKHREARERGEDDQQTPADGDKAEEQVVFDEPEDAGILARLARKEPASYVSIAMRPGGLQDYVDVWNELN